MAKWFHMNSLYRVLLEVPLLIRYPQRRPQGTVIESPVSLRDIPRTALALTGSNLVHCPRAVPYPVLDWRAAQ